jgi:hypothetical protein
LGLARSALDGGSSSYRLFLFSFFAPWACETKAEGGSSCCRIKAGLAGSGKTHFHADSK